MRSNSGGDARREETEISLLQQQQEEQQDAEPDAFSPTTTTRAEEVDDPLPPAPVVDDDHQDDDDMESTAHPQTDTHTDDTNEEEEPMTTEDPEPLVPFHQPLGDHSNDNDTSDHHHNQEQEPKEEEETPLVSSIYNEIHGSLGDDESQQLHPHETIVDLDNTRQEQEQPVVDCRLVEEKEEPDTPETQREPLHLDTNNNMEDERHPIRSEERTGSVEEEKDDNDANKEEDDDENEHEMEDPQSHKVPGEYHVFSLEEWFACPDDWFAAHGPCVECRSTNCFVQDTVVSVMTHQAANLHQVHHTQPLHNYLERIREEVAEVHRQEAAHALLLHLRQQQQARQQRHWERQQERRRLEEEQRQQQQQAKRLQLRPIPILTRFANLPTTATTTIDETTDPDDNNDEEELDTELDASTCAEYDLTDEEFDLLLHQLETEPIFEELEPNTNETTTVDARWDQEDTDDDEDLDETDWIIPPHDFSIDFPRLVLSPVWNYHSNTTIGRLTGLQLWDLGEELDQRDTQLLLDASEPSLVLQSRFLEEEEEDDDEYEQDELNVTNQFHDQHQDGSSTTRPIANEMYDELEDDEEEEEELNEGDVWILTESNEYAPASTL